MSQKDYKLEIISILSKEETHIREIARKLKTNQTTIARKVKELYEGNVIDYREEGKNKIIFLKKTIESFKLLKILEHYKAIKLLKEYPFFRKIFQKMLKDKRIKLAILFGSFAKGTATDKSDIDIFIETKSRQIKKEIETTYSRVSVKIGLFNRTNLLIKEIEKNHIILKGVDEYYEKVGFFEESKNRR